MVRGKDSKVGLVSGSARCLVPLLRTSKSSVVIWETITGKEITRFPGIAPISQWCWNRVFTRLSIRSRLWQLSQRGLYLASWC